MIEEREFRGYWWLPENPDHRVGGIAKFDPDDGVSLEVFSLLKDDPEYLGSDSVFKPEFIHGVTVDGERVTLVNSTRGNYSMSSKQGQGATSATYLAITLLAGAHFSDSVEFDRLRVRFPLLNEWAGITGTSYSGSMLEGGRVSSGDTFEISYEFPEEFSAEVGEIEIKLLVNADFNIQRVGGAEINEHTFFEITPKSGKLSYQDGLDYMGKLQDLITIATGKEVQPISLLGRLNQGEDAGYNDVDILFSTIGPPKIPDKLHPMKANFVLADMVEQFEEVLNNWFSKSDELKPVYNLYFSVQYHFKMYLQIQFLSLIQALETYHRREIGGQYLSDDEFDEFYEDLCEAIPDDYGGDFREHLQQGTFKYANEYSLRKRLDEIIAEHDEVINQLPLNIESNVRLITNTRNYLTHYDEEISPRADVDELHGLILQLSGVIETVLLNEIGIPTEQIVERLNTRYSELTR